MREEICGRFCERCACWTRKTDDEQDDDYNHGYCQRDPPIHNEDGDAEYPETWALWGCYTGFVLIPGGAYLMNDQGVVIPKTNVGFGPIVEVP